MWKTLIVVVSEQNKDRELDNFLARVKAQGIEVIEIEPALYVKRYKIGTVCKKESLLLTLWLVLGNRKQNFLFQHHIFYKG